MIGKILVHLDRQVPLSATPVLLPPVRGPPCVCHGERRSACRRGESRKIRGAFYLKALDEALGSSGLYYVRYMDDIVVLAPSRWRLRHAIRTLQQVFARLKLRMHPDKTFIGRIERGFDFLGYHYSRGPLTLAAPTVRHFGERLHRLYEQQKTAPAGAAVLGDYVTRRHLERRGLLVRDAEAGHLSREPGEDADLEALQGHSISYRIAVGPHEGRKAFTLQTVPARNPGPSKPHLATAGGFSLHAGVAVGAADRATLERLCRYITRPALATGRLALTPQGRVRYTLKTPYRDGTTHVIFEPLDFMARLAALVPRPRVHLTRFHGVFAPHSGWRAQITPAKRGGGKHSAANQTPAERHRAMTWAQRLQRVFKLDLESCEGCGGQVRVIACIEDPGVIAKILSHLEQQPPSVTTVPPLPARGPPRQGVLALS